MSSRAPAPGAAPRWVAVSHQKIINGRELAARPHPQGIEDDECPKLSSKDHFKQCIHSFYDVTPLPQDIHKC